MELRSQAVRKLAPENDPLKIGMGWKVDDLAKPQIMVESTFGDSHPGSAHLDQFVKEAVQAVNTHGGKAARYFATDMCDGIAQGHDGINYSLPHRDAIVNLVEAQANATVYDGGVFIASCDKSMPAMLMSIGRLKDMSAIVVTGGVMEAHTLPKKYVVNDPACAINDLLTLEQIGKFDAWEKTGVIPNEQLDYYKHNACPSCGACSFMGTASTMQIMAEALGLMLPGTALMPATAPELKQAAYDAGVQVMKLVAEGIKAKDIVTMKSFENAIMVHAAISGSTNATMHLPAIAHEFGFEIDADTFDRMHRGAHYLLNIRPSGDWPAQYFYYAGGVPRVMEEIKSMLHLDVMTVTGKTLGENLEELKNLGGLDGLLCLGTFSKSMVRQIEAFKKPTVFLDAMPKGDQFDCVVNDLDSSVEAVMDYLTGLGHKKIAFIGGYEVDKDGEEVHDERMVTYKKYMERIGEFSPALVRVGSFTPEDGYVLCREILEGKEKPTAIFANNDSLAVGCYRAVSEKGLRIPEDVSIVGYNDIAVANYLVPPLTTVRLHMELLGEEAVRLLRERITSSREIGLKVIVPAKLIVRGSADRVK